MTTSARTAAGAAIAASHAATLDADAAALDACVSRLRALAENLRSHPAAPPWLHPLLDSQITACTIAAQDVATAAHHLHALTTQAPSP